LTVLEEEVGCPSFRELVASYLSFPTRLISLESEFYNSDIVKNLRRGQTVTVQKRDSNSWTITVQMFVDEQF
jgi:hypothetical protein